MKTNNLGLLLLLALSIACSPTSSQTGDTTDPDGTGGREPLFAGPEGVVVFQDLVVVANSNASWDGDQARVVYGPGFLTVLDPEDPESARRLEVRGTNPQMLAVGPDLLAVVCSGTVTMNEAGAMVPEEAGGVELFDPDLESVAWIPIPNQGPLPLSGFPGSAAFSGDLLVVGSGTGSVYWLIDVAERRLLETRAFPQGDEGSDLISVTPAGGGTALTSFSLDRIIFLDKEGAPGPCGQGLDLDDSPGDLGGAVAAVQSGDSVFVLLSMASSLTRVEPSTCMVKTRLAITGASPNHVAGGAEHLFVVNSLDNNVQRVKPDSGETENPFVVLPPGTNPWAIAVLDDRAYVTGYLTEALYELDLTSGEILRTMK